MSADPMGVTGNEASAGAVVGVLPAIEVRGLSFAYSAGAAPGGQRDIQPAVDVSADAAPDAESDAAPDAAPAFSLRDIDLSIPPGTVNVVIGPSGCGKTTLLRCLTGVIPSIIKGGLSGVIRLNGKDIITCENGVCKPTIAPNEIALTAGLVMQEPDHYVIMTTVEDDIAFGPENRMVPPDDIRAAVDRCAGVTGLANRLTDDPAILSGGGKQRLAIAGTLASAPGILLFDEPVSGLDAAGRAMFAELVKGLRSDGRTILIVEHDYEEFSFADTWILMKEGRVISASPPGEADRLLTEGALWL
jgi:energy-coupling factor transport system ATP-binding protein